jgi:hypothetical protein
VTSVLDLGGPSGLDAVKPVLSTTWPPVRALLQPIRPCPIFPLRPTTAPEPTD